jgi:hypothetical protein
MAAITDDSVIATPELAGPERPVTGTPGFHPLIGLDDRAVVKGLQRNDQASNINAFAPVLRTRDEAYYSEMPMNTDQTDPSNTMADTEKVEQLRQILQSRVKTLQKPASTPASAPKPATPSSALKGSSYVAPPTGFQGFWFDLRNWNTLPVQPGWNRVHYVMTRDQRMVWLLMFIIVMMIFGYLVQTFIK